MSSWNASVSLFPFHCAGRIDKWWKTCTRIGSFFVSFCRTLKINQTKSACRLLYPPGQCIIASWKSEYRVKMSGLPFLVWSKFGVLGHWAFSGLHWQFVTQTFGSWYLAPLTFCHIEINFRDLTFWELTYWGVDILGYDILDWTLIVKLLQQVTSDCLMKLLRVALRTVTDTT